VEEFSEMVVARPNSKRTTEPSASLRQGKIKGMDEHDEDELLMHVAAGTDLPTALAALPRESDVHDDRPARAQTKSIGRLFWAVLIFVSMMACWWLIA
jgi:hypothetical protein